MLNREQRRKMAKYMTAKDLAKDGITLETAKKILTAQKGTNQISNIKAGDKVILNVNRLLNNKTVSDKFRVWVEEHKDEVFTAFYERNNSVRVCLEEDTSIIRWLFYWEDLVKRNPDGSEIITEEKLKQQDAVFESIEEELDK